MYAYAHYYRSSLPPRLQTHLLHSSAPLPIDFPLFSFLVTPLIQSSHYGQPLLPLPVPKNAWLLIWSQLQSLCQCTMLCSFTINIACYTPDSKSLKIRARASRLMNLNVMEAEVSSRGWMCVNFDGSLGVTWFGGHVIRVHTPRPYLYRLFTDPCQENSCVRLIFPWRALNFFCLLSYESNVCATTTNSSNFNSNMT